MLYINTSMFYIQSKEQDRVSPKPLLWLYTKVKTDAIYRVNDGSLSRNNVEWILAS